MANAKKALAVMRGLGVYVVFLLLPSVFYGVVQLFFPAWSGIALQFLTNFSTILTAGVLLLVYRAAGKSVKDAAGISRQVCWADAAAAFFFGLLGNFAVSFGMNFLPASWLASYGEQSAAVYDAAQPLLSVLAITILAPVGEEILFRGLIYRSFREAMPFWGAAGLSALLFGAAHLHPVWICYAFGMGFCFAVMVKRKGNLLVSILAHVGFNLGSLPSLLLSEESLWFRLVYGSVGGYLLFHLLCIGGCLLLWARFFAKSRIMG